MTTLSSGISVYGVDDIVRPAIDWNENAHVINKRILDLMDRVESLEREVLRLKYEV